MATAQTVTIQNVRPGELGKLILKQVDNLRDVESLTVQGGTLGDADFVILYNVLRKVRTIDLYGVSNTYFPSVSTSYAYGFTRCDSLRTIRLPKNLDRLAPTHRESGNIFYHCRYLETIEIPAGVRQIPERSFEGCDRLREVTFHEGLERIGQNAFAGCDSLKTVSLPTTLVQADAAFSGCDNLYQIVCLGMAPPVFRQYDLFGYELGSSTEYIDAFMKRRLLVSPKGSNYALTQGWNRFQKFAWTDSWPKDIRVNTEWNLLSELPQNKPNVTLAVGMDNASQFWYAGRMSVNSGSNTLSLGTFNIEQDAIENGINEYYDRENRWNVKPNNTRDICWPTLLTQSPMRADTVRATLRWHGWSVDWGHSAPKWSFSSLPFDCKVGDLRVTRGGKNLQYSIMKYSGLLRSKAQFNEVWIKQTNDSVIHAGEGFIIAVGWDTLADPYADLTFTAINNEHKNRLFTTDDVSMTLKQYTAAAACDRSWNFIGNPYPCFYSTKYLDPAAPFVVYDRDNRRYQVYSPIDDDYVLRPFEGFFIQKPLGYDEIDFPRYGRFQTIAEYEAWKNSLQYASRRAQRQNREVHNIHLSGIDQCRLVACPEASADYEAGIDATKFPQFDGDYTLLYIIGQDDTRYAISEQPFGEGDTLRLGLIIAEDGDYTLAADSTLTLIDRETGTSTILSQPYTFQAKQGEYNARFAITKTARRGYVTSQQMITVNDVEYYISTDDTKMHRGRAFVSKINSTNETVEIPAFITYDGELYEVYGYYSNDNPPATLKHLILPSTITSSIPFSDQYDVTLYALTPPDMSTASFYDDNQYTLYVPKAVVNDYKTSYPYLQIANILPAETHADLLCVQGSNVTIDDNSKPSNKPSLDIRQFSGISVEGSRSMSLSNFDMECIIEIGTPYSNKSIGYILQKDDNATGTLITSSPMTADKVNVTFCNYSNYPHFYYLPFNVKVADIIDNRNNGQLHIYRYNSAQRASGQYGSNWQQIGSDETIKAGEGFFMDTYTPGRGTYCHFTFPAIDDAKKNDIFATSQTINLTDYPASKAEDRGWNLVGNPYPAYYDMSKSTLQQPYQLYGQMEGSADSYDRYYAYSRDDDDILVRPFEGFFVQYSDSEKSFSMPGSGRYHGYPEFIYEKTYRANALRRAAEESRWLYDIELKGTGIHDRTRIVLNQQAKADFEPACDAVKLDNSGTMLYTIENDVRLAINERPAPQDGMLLIAEIDADGTYTLSLSKHNAGGIILTDLETGTQVSLDTDSYTFTTKAGQRRFSIGFGNGTTYINTVEPSVVDTPTFDLQGRKVEGTLKAGVYVRNGRKVIIK